MSKSRPSRGALPVAIVLAAGRSTRMGAIDKLLLPLQGKAMLLHAIDRVRPYADSVFVVTMPREKNPLVAELLENEGVNIVENGRHDEGMGTSIAECVRAVDGAHGYMIVPGDMPLIAGRTVKRLVQQFIRSVDKIVVPMHEGRRGHPVIFPSWARTSLIELNGDRGGVSLLEDNWKQVQEVVVRDIGICHDIDKPTDYHNLVTTLTE